ncbi:serine hydrolase [Streptomyces sp. WP-1]|uniref:serine hydrolase domain-containing protein n=1 Tax=Streptomyces sp. WP-1 TaxID=3041497 RepID=UPI00351AD779
MAQDHGAQVDGGAGDRRAPCAGPYGRVIATAGDLARLARMHLAGGVAEDGTRVLSEETVALMQRRVVDCPDKWTVSSDGWGLGWTLYDWNGVGGYGHDGASIGQYAYLRVVPSAGVAVALLTNGGGAREVYAALHRELLADLAGVAVPEPFGPSATPPVVDRAPLVGTYRREGVVITVTEKNGAGHALYEFVDGMKDPFGAPADQPAAGHGDGLRRHRRGFGLQHGLHTGDLLQPARRHRLRPHRHALRPQGRLIGVVDRPGRPGPAGGRSPSSTARWNRWRRRARPSSRQAIRAPRTVLPECPAAGGDAPEAVAAVAFLASPDSGLMLGTTPRVNGGENQFRPRRAGVRALEGGGRLAAGLAPRPDLDAAVSR